MNELKIGIIGIDTSHAIEFSKILNGTDGSRHVPGGRVTVAYPGGSPDFPLSINRVDDYTKELKLQHGVEIVDTLEEVAARCDAILLESADGRVHLEQFKRIAPYGKPVFIHKPLALKAAEAEEIGRIAVQHGVPVMSSSSLRYANAVRAECEREREGGGSIAGADVFGPLNVEPTQTHYFWYGIHLAEMLFALMGAGCEEVTAVSTDSHDVVTGRWSDGRIGTIRGSRGGGRFGALVHRTDGAVLLDAQCASFPYYADMLEQVMTMFTTGSSPLVWEETVAIIRFLEAAGQSRAEGAAVCIL